MERSGHQIVAEKPQNSGKPLNSDICLSVQEIPEAFTQGLKIWFPQGSGGSSPSTRTNRMKRRHGEGQGGIGIRESGFGGRPGVLRSRPEPLLVAMNGHASC